MRYGPKKAVSNHLNTILQQAEPPKSNITKEQHDALTSQKEDKSIMVLPADEGPASVVLDTDTYHATISVLIDSGPYHLLNKTDRRVTPPFCLHDVNTSLHNSHSLSRHMMLLQTNGCSHSNHIPSFLVVFSRGQSCTSKARMTSFCTKKDNSTSSRSFSL